MLSDGFSCLRSSAPCLVSVFFCVCFCCVLPLSCIQFSKLKKIFVQVNHRLVETSIVYLVYMLVASLAAD